MTNRHAPWLSRASLRRVVGSLLGRELAAARGQGARSLAAGLDITGWSDDVRLSGDGHDQPGCDSLELLRLGAAVNEMFHLHEVQGEADLLRCDRVGNWLDAIEAAWRGGVDDVTFITSGSTGTPRRCTHGWRHLITETTFLTGRFGDRRRIVALAPAHHIYGLLFTARLADDLGLEVWVADRASAAELAHGLRDGDLVVSFPDRWAWLGRSLPAIPPGVVGVVSTAAMPPTLWHELRHKGLSELVEVYGSSETAGIALRTSPSAPFRLMPHWRLETDPDAPPGLLHDSGFRAAMPDVIDPDGRDTFLLMGRTDGAVQVGGLNVYPASVATRLRACPGVDDVVVRLMRPDEGTRLKAFVTPEPGVDLLQLEAALGRWASQNLSTVERPRTFTFGSRLPRSPIGKAADW